MSTDLVRHFADTPDHGCRPFTRAVSDLGAEEDRLRQSRVGVDREAEVLRVGAGLQRQHGLRDQLARVDPDYAGAQDLLVLLGEDDLGEALLAAHPERAAARAPG